MAASSREPVPAETPAAVPMAAPVPVAAPAEEPAHVTATLIEDALDDQPCAAGNTATATQLARRPRGRVATAFAIFGLGFKTLFGRTKN